MALIILLVLLSFVMFSGQPPKSGDGPSNSGVHLQLNGKILKTNKKASLTYTVTLIRENTPIETKTILEGKSFKFALKESAWYAVEIKREGHLPKLISIHTELPHHRFKHIKYTLSFEVDDPVSHAEAAHLDPETVHFPVAIISFCKEKEVFNCNEDYHCNIRKNILW